MALLKGGRWLVSEKIASRLPNPGKTVGTAYTGKGVKIAEFF